MEQNGKNRRPYNNNNKKYKKKNTVASSQDGLEEKKGAAFEDGGRSEKKKGEGAKRSAHDNKKSHSHGGDVRTEWKDDRRDKKRKGSAYGAAPALVDSYEAEERKQGGKGNAPEKESSKPRGEEPKGKRPERARPNRSGKAQKARSVADYYGGESDSFIHTISDRQYIPFDSYDDDEIIPDVADAYDSYERPSSRTDKKSIKNGRRDQRRDDRYEDRDGGIPGAVVGRNAVRELLRSDRSVDKLYVKSGAREGSIVVIVAEAVSKKIPIVEVTDSKLDSMAGGSHHQGVVALAAEKQYTDIDSILKLAEERGETPLVVIADGIEDPQNLGAIIRCAECAGVHGIIIPKRRAVGLTPIVTKASAGAIEHMAIAKVSNLADAVEKLKKAGLWIFAAEAGGTPYYEVDFKGPAAIVLGSEGFGVSRLIKERSDFTVSIPMYGKVNSLNVSTAASVILCHAARMQRS